MPERPVAARAILTAFSAASAPVVKKTVLAGPLKGAGRVQPLGQADIGLVGHHLEGGVREALGLLGHRRHHLGVAVAGVEHGDAAGEVDVAAALDVPDLGVLGALGIDRGRVADAARHGGVAAGEQLGIGGHRCGLDCFLRRIRRRRAGGVRR